MANTDSPYGLRPYRYLDGTPYTGGTIKCEIVVATGVVTFIGDPVTLDAGTATEHYPVVAQMAAADTQIFGVITSFDPDRDDLTSMHRAVSTKRLCNVVPAANMLFVCNSDGPTTYADVGQAADLIGFTSGSTTTGISAVEFDDSDIGTGNHVLLMGFDERPDNEIGAAGVDVIVRINESAFHPVITEV